MEKSTLKAYQKLLRSHFCGVLASHSQELTGYPAGSIVPYALDRLDRPIVLISRLAQHTRNVLADPRVSLSVWDAGASDVLAAPRLNLLADIKLLSANDTDAKTRYLRHYPKAEDYLQLDFDFYALEPRKAHFIAGFAKVYWLDSVAVEASFAAEQEAGILQHMNADHSTALTKYLHDHTPSQHAENVEMVGIDPLGMNLRAEENLYRINFPEAVSTPGAVRKMLTAMAHQ